MNTGLFCTGVMRNSKRTNEKGRLQHPLGAHPRRRRSTLINIQEKSPQHYSRPDSDSRSDMSSDELEKEHKLENDVVHTRVRPLAAHHSRRRVSMASRLQNSLTSAGPTCAVANNNVDRDMEDNMKPKQGRVQEPTQGQSREHLPPCQRKLAWTH